eukprot:scaffold301756_cov41-Tisochrysis_lutea.AAC.2
MPSPRKPVLQTWCTLVALGDQEGRGNHTGYPAGWKGEVLQGNQLNDLVDGLEANHLLQGYSYILTGYIGSASFLNAVMKTVQRLREASPGVSFLCDPVMGDHGKLYVPKELVQIYREQSSDEAESFRSGASRAHPGAAEVVPLASVLTPNRFEAELLTDRPIASKGDAAEACRELHERGPHTVLITSMSFEGDGATPSSYLLMMASRKEAGGAVRQWTLQVPRIDKNFTGTGDLTAALFLAWMHRKPSVEELPEVLEKVGATLQTVLGETTRLGRSEIALIQSQDALRAPTVEYHAQELSPE